MKSFCLKKDHMSTESLGIQLQQANHGMDWVNIWVSLMSAPSLVLYQETDV
jgi:hypothetical protein